ncbi:MAG: FAD-dependent thymidylate synthase [Synechococcaceae cyanobacterium RM1_1_27]|nr:FAD-dependent thymidylate synthase [Synechococcaceae cyanobacterium SM2_3_2]NJO86398.1 FAD-dependent thymidylate synthase [Synechococcaceae cyanobacterium RM1_1_27]
MRIDNILGDGIGFVELQDHMGGDTQVVNSARVSYGKQVDTLSDKDKRLIKRLISDKHVSVLRSTVFTFRVACPLAIRNQWYRHVIGGAYANDQIGWNEISRRYTAVNRQYYIPADFRGQDPDNKQASVPLEKDEQEMLRELFTASLELAEKNYEELLAMGVAREQARMILPQCLYTEFLWTASLQAVIHFLELRDKPEAQWEIVAYAQGIRALVTPIVPTVLALLGDPDGED